MSENEIHRQEAILKAIRVIVYCIAAGMASGLIFSLQARDWWSFTSVLAVALAVAGASLLAGGLMGFLFGIPKTLQQDNSGIQKNEDKAEARAREVSYQANTNLEQISDWLTKILVGVGLTQLIKVPGALTLYAAYIAPGLGNFASSKVYSIALLLYFLICGFLLTYLWTRRYLAGALRQADIDAIGGKMEQVVNMVNELENQIQLDARALSLAQRHLNPSAESKAVPPEDLGKAIMQASRNVRAQIFYQAQTMRSENWSAWEKKPVMERTIPVFRFLIDSDLENIYHANHGQLGFALKDQRKPNYTEAEAELTKAIEIRGSWKENGWLMYEFVRAICKINLDSGFQQDLPSDEKSRQSIINDLKDAANAAELERIMQEDPAITKWMKLNKVTIAKIRP